MADKQLRFVLTGVDQGASKTIDNLGAHGQSSAQKLGGAFSKLGGQISGELGEVLTRTGEGFDKLGEKGMSTGQKLAAMGGLAMGAGALLSVMGAKETQATNALSQSITNTGQSMADYQDEKEKTVKHMEKYGDTAVSTKEALAKLTDATHDPAKALGLMQTAADLAAASHISLVDASQQVAKAFNGSARLFKQYGIEVHKNADGTKDYQGAIAALGQELAGRANASSTTFLGTLHRIRAEVTDGAAAWGQKYGPALTAAGAATMVLGPVIGATKDKLVAYRASSKEAAVATDELTAAQGRSKLAMLGGTAVIGAVAAGAYMGGRAIANWTEKNNSFAQATKNLGTSLDSLRVSMLNAPKDAEATGKSWLEAQLQADGLAAKAAKAGITLDQMTTAIQGGKQSTQQLIDQWKASGKPSGDTITALALLSVGYAKTADTSGQAADGTAGFAAAQGTATVKALSLDAALKYQNDQFNSLDNRFMTAEKALIAFKDSEDKLSAAFKANGKHLDDNTAKGRANLTAVFDSIDMAQKHAAAVLQQTHSTEQATAAYQADIGALRAHLKQLGLTPPVIQAIIDKYARIPTLKKTTVDLKDDASRKLAELNDELIRLTTRKWSVSVGAGDPTFSLRGTGTKFHAGGTQFAEGGDTMVAERETEIINLPRGSGVTPLSQVKAASSGDTYNITVQMPMLGGPTPPEIARALVGALQDARRYGYTGG